MKTRNFDEILEARLNKAEIAEIRLQAKIEADALRSLQSQVSGALEQYMKKEDIGFNELVRRMGVTPTQASKIKKGEANMTLATLAHISALFGKKPKITFQRA